MHPRAYARRRRRLRAVKLTGPDFIATVAALAQAKAKAMTDEEFFAELDRLGMAEVRRRLASNAYVDKQAALARSWVERWNEASSAELLLLARQEAYSANKMAQLALAMAAIAIIVAIMAMFHKP
jgi:hypothetical protein